MGEAGLCDKQAESFNGLGGNYLEYTFKAKSAALFDKTYFFFVLEFGGYVPST